MPSLGIGSLGKRRLRRDRKARRERAISAPYLIRPILGRSENRRPNIFQLERKKRGTKKRISKKSKKGTNDWKKRILSNHGKKEGAGISWLQVEPPKDAGRGKGGLNQVMNWNGRWAGGKHNGTRHWGMNGRRSQNLGRMEHWKKDFGKESSSTSKLAVSHQSCLYCHVSTASGGSRRACTRHGNVWNQIVMTRLSEGGSH